MERYLDAQLHPNAKVALPETAQTQIDVMQISQKTMAQLVEEAERQRKTADAMANDTEKKAAQQAYQQQLNRLAREAAARSLLRDLYSPQQLQEQMTWFWMNHFSVHQAKGNLRLMMADYEDSIRAHALGRFRDLLAVTVRHPAMLGYLDNEQNAQGRINDPSQRVLQSYLTASSPIFLRTNPNCGLCANLRISDKQEPQIRAFCPTKKW